MSLNGSLSVAANALNLFSLGIQVAGNNISNANTPGYVREQLDLTTNVPTQYGSLVIGNGAVAAGVRQQLDKNLALRILGANSDANGSSVQSDVYQQLETTLNSLGDTNLASQVKNFQTSVQGVVNQPDTTAPRTALINQGQQLAQQTQQLRGQIQSLQSTVSDKLSSDVTEANQLIDQIATLNPQITKLETNGLGHTDAGNLRVQRQNALNRLSQILPIQVQEQPSGAVNVYSKGEYLIQESNSQHLQLSPTVPPGAVGPVVLFASSGEQTPSSGGEIAGYLQSRDNILQGFNGQLDTFAHTLIDQVNRIHSSGEGLSGFTSVTGTNSVTSTTAALNAAGLAFAPNHGSFDVKIVNTGSNQVTTTNIPVKLDGIGTQTSLSSLVTALNGVGNLNASITSDGKLKLTTNSGYEVRFGNDTSGTLASLGVNTFFTGSDATDIGVNQTLLTDPSKLASGRGAGTGDNSNAVALANVFNQSIGALNNQTIADYYTTAQNNIGQQSAAEQAVSSGFTSFRDSLNVQQQQISGVSLDQEMINVLQLQHNYQVSAKIVSTIDSMLNTLIQL